eukprot:COSAG01_NODE_67608_length_266_cov_1.143713_1_plen_75_part_01
MRVPKGNDAPVPKVGLQHAHMRVGVVETKRDQLSLPCTLQSMFHVGCWVADSDLHTRDGNAHGGPSNWTGPGSVL